MHGKVSDEGKGKTLSYHTVYSTFLVIYSFVHTVFQALIRKNPRSI